jgi:hypothetical protein
LALLVVVVLAAVGAVAGTASATIQTTTLADDNLAVGTQVTQSANGEIQAGDPAALGFASGATPGNGVLSDRVCGGASYVVAASPTNTPLNALQMPYCGPQEFWHEGALFTLTDTADTVTAYVGNPGGVPGGEFRLDAYDVQHNILYSDTVTAGAGVTTPISVGHSGIYTIAFVALYNTAKVSYFDAFDDLSVHSGGGSPDISLSVTPPIGRLAQGGTLQYGITVVRQNGSSGNVALGISGLPAGVKAAFGAQTLTGTSTTSSVVLTADASQALGHFPVTLTATPALPSVGSGPRSSTFDLQVVHAFDVLVGGSTLLPSSAGVKLRPCSTGTTGVNTVLAPGFHATTQSPVNLNLSSADAAGITASLQQPSLQDSDLPYGQGVQSLTVSRDSSAAPAGDATVQITPSSGPLSSDPATVTVERVAPDMTSVTPEAGNTPYMPPPDVTSVTMPRTLQPGTTVTVIGQGFCPDSTVEFGNSNATVPAGSVNAAGTQLTAQVPALATTGRLTVTSGGQSATSTTDFTVDNFRDTYAYSFHNFRPNLEFDHMTEAFGYDATHTLIGTPDPVAFVVQKIARALYRGKNGGACFGFSLSASRLMSGKYQPLGLAFPFPLLPAPKTAFELPGPSSDEPGPQHNDALYAWFHGFDDWATEANYITWNHVQELSWDFLVPVLSDYEIHREMSGSAAATDVYNEIQNVLSSGRFPLMVLSLEHVVTAYAIEGTPPDYYVDVWDSNAPFPSDFASSRVHITSHGNYFLPSTGINGTKYGLSVLDPAAIPRYPTMIGETPLNRVFPFAADQGARAASARPGLDSIVVSDGAVRTAGANGATGANVVPFTLPDTGPHGPSLLAVWHHSSPVRVTVADTSSGTDTHTVLGHGYVAELTTRADRGSSDNLTLGPGGATGFSTTSAIKPLMITMIGGSLGSRRMVEIDTTSYRGGGDGVSFNDGIAYLHRGRATTFTIALSDTNAGNGASRFESGPLTIASGQTAQITQIKWGSLNNAVLSVRLGGRTLIVRNHVGTLQLTRITGLTVTRTAGKTIKLTISAAARKLPAGAQLAFSWLIRRGRHSPVAHSLLAQPGTKSAIYTFNAPSPGRYTLNATISVVMPNGSILSTSTRSLAFKV